MLDILNEFSLNNSTSTLEWQFLRYVWTSAGMHFVLLCNLNAWEL